MNFNETMSNTGYSPAGGPSLEEIANDGSRAGTPIPASPEVSGLLLNLNQRLQLLESRGSSPGSSNHGVPKIGLPEKFSGNISRCRDFVLSVENVFALQPGRYPSDEIKSRFVGTLLTHEALAWFRDIVERKPHLLSNFHSFILDFRAYFDDPNAKRHAAAAIGRLKQAKGSVLVYSSKFRRLAYDTGFNNDALVDIFRRGLNDDIKDRLSQALDEPSELEEFVALCNRIDQRLYDRRIEKTGQFTRSFTPRFNAPRQMSLSIH